MAVLGCCFRTAGCAKILKRKEPLKAMIRLRKPKIHRKMFRIGFLQGDGGKILVVLVEEIGKLIEVEGIRDLQNF